MGPRFPSDVTAFYCEQSGIVVVAGLADFLVRVINTSDFITVSLKEHAAPVPSVALAKEGDVVATLSFSKCGQWLAIPTEQNVGCWAGLRSGSRSR